MSSGRLVRGRRGIAHELHVSERTVTRMVDDGRLEVFREGPEHNSVMVADLPMVTAALARNDAARAALKEGGGYKPSAAERLEARAWRRSRWPA